MDSKPQKHFMRFLIGELREMNHQLLAHIIVGHLAEEAGFPYIDTLKRALATPEIRRRADERIDGLDELVDEMDDSIQDRLIQEYLAKQGMGEKPN
jgi:hypothetical protein